MSPDGVSIHQADMACGSRGNDGQRVRRTGRMRPREHGCVFPDVPAPECDGLTNRADVVARGADDGCTSMLRDQVRSRVPDEQRVAVV